MAWILPNVPRDSRATKVTDTSVNIYWGEPLDNGVSVLGYLLTYGPAENPTAVVERLDAETTQYVIRGLEPDTQYRLHVTAYNQFGRGPPSEVGFWTSTSE